MKAFVVGLVSVLAGMAISLVNVWWEFAGVVPQFEPNRRPAVSSPSSSGSADPTAHPKAVVQGGLEYDFGPAQRDTSVKHSFPIKNEGNAPLKLTKGQTSCRCTLSDLANDEVPPGGTTEVTMEVKLTTLGQKFRQTAEVTTNDPERRTIQLVMHGIITDRVRLDPIELTLSRASSSEGATAQFRMFSYVTPEMQVVRHSLSRVETAGYFELAFEPLPPADVQAETGAKSGVLARLTVKPGLPLGPINQTIRLVTNVPEAPEMELTVNGAVVGDISILGSRIYDDERSTIRFGNVARDEGAKAELKILVKGPARGEVRPVVKEVDPATVLAVTLGERHEINNGAVIMWPLEVEVRKGAPTVNRLGSEQGKLARIVLETNHPDMKTINLYVKFAVK